MRQGLAPSTRKASICGLLMMLTATARLMRPLIGHQAMRHKLVDMQARVHSARALLYDTAWKLMQAPREAAHIAQLAMLKNVATDAMQFCADAAVQTLGGAGFVRGTRAERIYREAKVMQIGGGSTEIMKDLAARQLGWEP